MVGNPSCVMPMECRRGHSAGEQVQQSSVAIFRRDLGVPRCVRRVSRHSPVEVRRAVGPPDRSPLAECALRRVDVESRHSQPRGVSATPSQPCGAPCSHEHRHQAVAISA